MSTFLQIGSGVILFPLILRMLPSETVGVWQIFMSITVFINLLDFGFSPSFSRNVTYIFSGVSQLQKTGIALNDIQSDVNYSLLANTIKAMQWFYTRIAAIALVLLASAGTIYLSVVLNKGFSGNKVEIYIAWGIFCFVNTYNIYTLYYDALMVGSGKVKRNKQIIIISQLLYLLTSVVLILLRFDLIAIVIAQAVALIVKRILANRCFFNQQMRLNLHQFVADKYKEIIKVILPNSLKMGCTSLGAFLVLQASMIIGPFYVNLSDLGSYGITVQVVNLIASLGLIFYSTYIPKLGYLRVENNIPEIIKLYKKSIMLLLLTFIVCGFCLITLGNFLLELIHSKTFLLSNSMILVLLIIQLLERNHAIAGGFLLSKNEVPFFKASIISGACTVLLLLVMFNVLDWGIWVLILAPGIVQLAYQNWKWPLVLIKELKNGLNQNGKQ